MRPEPRTRGVETPGVETRGVQPAPETNGERLTGHRLRNAHLRERSLVRAQTAPPLASAIVTIRASLLGMTRLEFSRQSGIHRGTMRDMELGVHTPTRHTLQQFMAFCQQRAVDPDHLEELRRLYTGRGGSLEQFISRLELLAGSTRELARRVSISPTTLWEYRRGHFPLPLELLRKLCRAVRADPVPGEAIWHESERERLVDRGYPPAWAELSVLCARAGHTESDLLTLGISTASLRRLCYLELPPWPAVARASRALCRDDREWQALKRRWTQDYEEQASRPLDRFGPRLKRLRERQGVTRRDLADLFGIKGKKPARIIKYIEEDGFYSVQAFPAGLVSVLTADQAERARLLKLWQERRRQFHRRRRPETRTDLRLAREIYGLELQDLEPILGYSRLEYQRIERGVEPLLETARARILQAIHQAGRGRVEELLQRRAAREAERFAWRTPSTVTDLITRLAKREGGLAPLGRHLRQAGLAGLSLSRLRSIAHGREVPAWHLLERIALACGVSDLAEARRDWTEQYRARLQKKHRSPLGIELRLLIAEVASTLRVLSPKLGFNYSVLIRDLQRIDRDQLLRWFHVERILRAVGLLSDSERWREIHALWYTTGARNPKKMKTPLVLTGAAHAS
jgi:transcriptional regulator with XRE-family HTH domain